MEHERAGINLVQAAPFQEQAHVALQLLASHERLLKALHDGFLFGCERVGVSWVHGGENGVRQRVLHAVHHDGARVVVYLVQQAPVI